MNWTPTSIFDARDKYVVLPNGKRLKVKLYSDGWSIDNGASVDVWAACYALNQLQAELNTTR